MPSAASRRRRRQARARQHSRRLPCLRIARTRCPLPALAETPNERTNVHFSFEGVYRKLRAQNSRLLMRRLAMATRSLPAIASGPAEAAHSGIREVVNLALVTPGCIRLEVGEPNFPTPAHIVEAAIEFARKGQVKYTATAGLLSLRERLVSKLDRVNGIKAGVNNINCSIGGVGGIAAAVAALLEPGDEVLVPDPAWPNYRLMLAWAHGVLVPYACPPENEFLPDPQAIERQITPRTKMIIVNSPCNPTGRCFRGICLSSWLTSRCGTTCISCRTSATTR